MIYFYTVLPRIMCLLCKGKNEESSLLSSLPSDIFRYILKYFRITLEDIKISNKNIKFNEIFSYQILSFLVEDDEDDEEEGDWKFDGNNVTCFDEATVLNVDLFTDIYMYQEGGYDDKTWIFLVRHKYGFFVYLNTWSDYTGLGTPGCGNVYYSNDMNHMFKRIFTDKCRKLLLGNNKFFYNFNMENLELG